MDTASTIGPSALDGTPRSRSGIRIAVIGAVAATAINVALWVSGRAADVDFVASTPADPSMQIGVVLVALTTLAVFAAGWALLAFAARRSRRWTRVVVAGAAVFAVVSAAGPLAEAHSTAAGVLLAMMHLVTGTAFVIAATRVSAR